MTIRIEVFDAHTAPRNIVEGVHLAYVDSEADFFPSDPPVPLEHHLAYFRQPGGSHRTDLRWVAMDGETVAGASHTAMWADHADSGLVDIAVSKPYRRQGIGRQLLTVALDGLDDHGRTKVIIDVPDRSPMEGPVERLGLKKALGERISRLVVTEIDWDLMDRWIEQATERASDYDLLFLQPPIPEEHVVNWCKISEAMNTAPLEELELGDETMTPDKWRSIESSLAARDTSMRAVVAVHRPTGDFAGMSDLMAQHNHIKEGQQGDTVVDPAHRNKGLGRLVKASLIKRFVAEFPEVEWIDTGNAGSNEPMLNINVKMGFKPLLDINAWQGDIAAARSALNRRVV